MDYNPRCLVRDVSADVNTDYANSTSMLNLITQNDNLADFQNVMQGAIGSADLGVHGGGHYTIGGNPADDVYISPGDPMFYLHVSLPACLAPEFGRKSPNILLLARHDRSHVVALAKLGHREPPICDFGHQVSSRAFHNSPLLPGIDN